MRELDIYHEKLGFLWCDNLGANYLYANPTFKAYTKLVEVD